MFYNDAISEQNFKGIMENIAAYGWAKFVAALLVTTVNWIFMSNFDGLLVVAGLIALDTFTGTVKALKVKNCSSRAFFRVLVKCMVYFVLMATSALLDKALPTKVAMQVTMTFLGLTEAISIVENLVILDFPVAKQILKKIKSVSKKIT